MVAVSTFQGVALKPRAAARVSTRAVVPVRAQHQIVKKAAAAAAAVVPAILASPALALVDSRMNGDGVGLPLGVNEPVLGFHMLGVFAVIWAVFSVGNKDFGSFDDEKSGMDL